MWESFAAPVVGLLAALAAAPSSSPSPPVDAAPVLASTPFGALPGQQVTHTVTLSGSGTLTTTRVTFTTTVDLDGVTARAEPGRCAASPRTVVCDLGDLRLSPTAASPRITISGRVRPGAPPGTVVRNRVDVTSLESTATGARTASNAYLLPGSPAAPTAAPPASPAMAGEVPPPGRSPRLPAVAAVGAAIAAAVVAAALLMRRRLRRRHNSPPPDRL
ncbi:MULTISPECIES: hypothetical protein [unclassified Micromonospora]|uniref:hypothetical protein n=1 Tax=unclassified Micromonospora TaxID=2617518 RepID=UPI002FEEF28B